MMLYKKIIWEATPREDKIVSIHEDKRRSYSGLSSVDTKNVTIRVIKSKDLATALKAVDSALLSILS